MVNSRDKGKRGERDLAKVLSSMFQKEVRRGQQFSGVEGKDVIGLDGIHCEVKWVEKLNLWKAMEQAQRDAGEGEVPAVFHKKNGTGWLITVPLDRLFGFVLAVMGNKSEQN